MSGPSPDLFEKLSVQTAASPSLTRQQARPRRWAALAIGFVPLAIFLVRALWQSVERGQSRWLVALAWAALTIILVANVRRRAAAAPLGWPTRLAILWGPATMIAAVVLLSATSFGEGTRGGEHAGCLLKSVGMALLPLIALMYVERKSDPVAPGLRGSLLGTLAGLASALPSYLSCAAPSTVEHASLGHVVPVMIVALIGMLIGHRALALN